MARRGTNLADGNTGVDRRGECVRWLTVDIRAVAYDHPDAALLIAQVQQDYIVRYGAPDRTALDPAEFADSNGLFLIGYHGGAAIACGGWRAAHTRAAGGGCGTETDVCGHVRARPRFRAADAG